MADQADHYLRLQYLLSESCQVLRQVFNQKSKSDTRPGIPFSNLGTYLSFHEPIIKGLVKRKVIRQAQYDILFPTSAFAPALTVNDLDVTMLSALIINIFNTISPLEELSISNIRQTRNDLNHYGDIRAVTDAEFIQYWNILEKATNNLASTINATYAFDVSKMVSELKDKVLSPSVQFLLEIINGMSTTNHDVVKELRGELHELKRSTGKTESYLRNTVKVTNRENGKPCKRMRVYIPQLEKMKKRFRKTTGNLTGRQADDVESDAMYKKLSESRFLYVIGSTSSPYEDIVIGVIKRLELDETKCAEIKHLSEWRNVDSDDVQLVWIRNPLRRITIQREDFEEFHRNLDDVEEELVEPIETTEERLYIVITFDSSIHYEYTTTLKMQDKDIHNLLLEPFECQRSIVSMDHSGRQMLSHKGINGGYVHQNLKDQTNIFMTHCKSENPEIPANHYEEAKSILIEKKILRINGPRLSGKTLLAVRLMSNYPEGRCLVLQDPYDVRHVCLDDVSIILIDDIGGKYEPDKDLTARWYRQFDFLQIAIKAGKLSLIVVTDSTTFAACQLPSHEIFSSDQTLTLSHAVVQSITDGNSSLQGCHKRTSLWNVSFEKVGTVDIDGLCQNCSFLPDGRFIYGKYSVELMDSSLFQTLSKLDLGKIVHGLCPLSNTEVIISHRTSYLQLIDVSTHQLTMGQKIDLGDGVKCYSVDVVNGEIYALCKKDNTVYIRILNRHGQMRRQIFLSKIPFRAFDVKIKVGRDKIFVASPKLNQITCLSTGGDVLFHLPDDKTRVGDDTVFNGPTYMYIDGNYNLLVCCRWSDNIHLFNNDGTEHKVLSDVSEDVLFPNCVSYRESDGCLIVGSNKQLVVYKAR